MLLTYIGDLKRELGLVDNILQNIFIYDSKKNQLLVNFRFGISKDYNEDIIGGLVATINEFAGKSEQRTIRTISLAELKLLFISEKDCLFVFAVNPAYPDSQFTGTINSFADSFDLCFDNYEQLSNSDNAAVTLQIIYTYVKETISFELKLGPAVELYPFKMKEFAEKRSSELIGDTVMGPLIDRFDISESKVLSEQEGLSELLEKFFETFTEVLQISVLRFTLEGGIEKLSSGRLEKETEEEIYKTVLGMLNYVATLLQENEETRIIDLEGKWLYLHYVNNKSFIYLIVEDKSVLELVKPLIERVSSVLSLLYPDNI